jgi:hypothetical protein
MNSEFSPHGQFDIRLDGRAFVTEVEGPWNVQLVRRWIEATMPYCQELVKGGPWGGIAIVSRSMLCTPDALAELGRAVAYSVKHFNCVAHIMVAAPDVEGRGIIEPAFRQIYEGVCAYQFFNHYADAKLWLDQLLAKTPT